MLSIGMSLGFIAGAALLVRKSNMPKDDETLGDKAQSIIMLGGTGGMVGMAIGGLLMSIFVGPC